MSETILVVNAGSSSVKFQVFAVGPYDQLERRMRGQLEGIGTHPRLFARGSEGETLVDQRWSAQEIPDVPTAFGEAVSFLRAHGNGELPIAIGHRVVHGGPDFTAPTIVSGEVIKKLEPFIPLAPLHQPNNLAPIKVIHEKHPHLLQVACFDTSFHRGHPAVADYYAIPDELHTEGVRRYGFHGLSYEYIAGQLPDIAPEITSGRVIVAHLGSGASMCAMVDRKSIDSTMGFTALDGLPMGTRPGQLDAGVVIYLMQQKGMSADEIERFLYKDCGLKGLSGISNDVRDLLASSEPRAKFSLEYFVYRIATLTGMLAAAMGGIDGFVFTAGIGENAAPIRAAVLQRLAWLGFDLDAEANAAGASCITTKNSPAACFVIPTNEGLMIARHTLNALRAQSIPLREEKLA